MSKPDDIPQPLDHLPPADERDADMDVEQPRYPGTEAPAGTSPVSPETAADPRIGDADRHDVDTRPPS
ncbi:MULTISPECIES: hypothetical protein [Microbacterium]|uniref:Uncharacterized protein n=1 Tax=Microbacterium wangchenii TaxID=2541726 RepID=A0ABX5SPV6_9MICO|nr:MULTISPECIES: hypothetical protein [Microbacterium]MCK6066878.1 hypothetical protein [Microbacterium sp. EYE_512]QBR88185.1 hypothetical protein E4K62_05435 [Microbacterium wangchenii]TFV83694.1 hypothetical protein E4V99_00950 [Microbacterium sp. dk485]TXK18025.1 hypothetical protein FVP99_05365 [Microbacterium wangchenii]